MQTNIKANKSINKTNKQQGKQPEEQTKNNYNKTQTRNIYKKA